MFVFTLATNVLICALQIAGINLYLLVLLFAYEVYLKSFARGIPRSPASVVPPPLLTPGEFFFHLENSCKVFFIFVINDYENK